jgi:putative aldouronate transport system permease protein
MKRQKAWRRFNRERQLWISCIPLIAWVVIFAYVPMYGILQSFVNYIPGKAFWDCKWVGLLYFKQFFDSPDFLNVLRNTLAISALGLIVGFPAPIVLAVLLNELSSLPFKRTVQTISYLPYFISWVVVANIMFTLLGNEGLVNEVLLKLGLAAKPIAFMGEGKYFWGLLTSANVWKGVGWSSIIYLSAIAGIDQELYQAGTVDGLGRFGLIWHITLPGIRTTTVLLLILSIGGLLNAGFEQQLLIGNPQTREYYEVIDTYAFKYGIQMGRYSYGTAIGFFKSVIGLALVLLANTFAKKAMDVAVF